MKIKMRLTKNNGEVKWYRSGTIRRFLSRLTHDQFEKAYVWVGYGEQLDNHGKLIKFFNDGEYINKQKATQALRAFCA